MNAGQLTSERHDWETPPALFALLHDEFRFTLDAAASDRNALCPAFLTPDDDALARAWSGVVWCNPPYGPGVGKWVQKARDEARAGATVVMLIPVRTDTAWWSEFAMRAHEVRLIRGRLHFGVPGRDVRANIAPFPSAVLVFRPQPCAFPRFSMLVRPGLRERKEQS
jgi:phage N-6-adenine-methyltransferase